jgi:hypothetical protein
MYKRLALVLLIVLFVLSGCSAARSAAPSRALSDNAPSTAPEAAPGQPKDAFGGSSGSSSGVVGQAPAAPGVKSNAGQNIPEARRLVLRNADLTIVVDDPGQAMTAISRMAETMNGFVISSTLYKTSNSQGNQYPEAKISVRVPAEKLNDAMDQIKALVKNPGKDVTTESVSGQDVTKEYTDLQSRLTNLQQAEAQLKEIMGSATRTDDVMQVYNQLTQVQEQIEVIKGQIKYYEEASALSSINVLIQAQAAVQPLEIGGWQPVGVARDAIQALINGLQVVGTIVIWLILFLLPIVLIIVLPIVLLVWLLRHFRKPKTVTPPPAAPPANI